MKKAILTSLFCGLSVLGYAKETKNSTTQKIISVKKIYSFEKLKFSCIIFTTIRTIDENNNVVDERSVRTEGSGLACLGSDSDGIVRNVKTIKVIGVHP
ncbi:hypothetical protein ACI513_00955 [Chryseobacterium sp. M5]|uniref:hypothetical protein n=1 Tax=Chryseobacterium sp. M5 TaxID=3379128 RepID=UPI0038579071